MPVRETYGKCRPSGDNRFHIGAIDKNCTGLCSAVAFFPTIPALLFESCQG